MDDLLLSGFPMSTSAQWRELADRAVHRGGRRDSDLASGNTLEKLSTTTDDGLVIAALYTAEDDSVESSVNATFPRDQEALGAGHAWEVRQQAGHPDVERTREEIRADLVGGATSLWLQIGDGVTAAADVADVLSVVDLATVPIVLDAGQAVVDAVHAFKAAVRVRGLDPALLRGCLGVDPIGMLTVHGVEAGFDDAATLTAHCLRRWPGMRALVVNALPFHDAGATDSLELAYSIAAGVEYLRLLEDAGTDVHHAFGQLEFRYAATADQFMTVGKLRAARRMWAHVAAQCGLVGDHRQQQHAVTSWAMLTSRDPWNNIERTVLASFGAIAGGADALTVTPFDAPLHTPGKLSRAVARNVQTILLDEAFLGHVADPAGGSWYVESLTTELARKAWSEFQEIEAVGGLRQAVVSGLVEDRLAALRDKRSQGFAQQRDTIVGITDFLSSDEQDTDRDRPLTRSRDRARLPRLRWSEPFEAVRQRADAYQQLMGRPPQVFVVELGDLAETTPLTKLAGRLLSPGGVVTVMAPGAEQISSRVAAEFGASSTTAACICCAEAGQVPLAEETMRLLRDAGARLVMVLAADPTIEVPGADLVLHEEMDVLQLANRVLHEVGA